MLIFAVCRTRRNEMLAEWGNGAGEMEEREKEVKDASELSVTAAMNE